MKKFKFKPLRTMSPGEPTNGRRAGWAEAALDAFQTSVGDAGPAVSEENVRDLLADLLHLCDREGFDGRAEVESALNTWKTER